MNKEQFQKNHGKHVRIQPAMQRYENDGTLVDSVDDSWTVTSITDAHFTQQNRAIDHFITLGFDSYVNFHEDPAGPRAHQTTGIFILKVQIYMFEGQLQFAAAVAPGKALVDFRPPTKRQDILQQVRTARSATELERLRKQFAWSAEGVAAAPLAFDELEPAPHGVAAELGLQQGVDYVVDRFAWRYLVGAGGWWVTIAWEPIAGNTFESAFLNVRKWSSHPPWPDRMLTKPARELARPRGGQKCEFQAARGHRRQLAQLRYKLADLAKGHRLVMRDPAFLRQGGQQLVEVSFPPGGVLAGSVSPDSGPIENVLDPGAQPARGLGLRGPDRLKDFQDQPGINVLNGQGADYRAGVDLKNFRPLLGMLRVRPARFMRLDVGRRALREGNGLCGLQ